MLEWRGGDGTGLLCVEGRSPPFLAIIGPVVGSGHARGLLGRHEVFPTRLVEGVFLMLISRRRCGYGLRQDGEWTDAVGRSSYR